MIINIARPFIPIAKGAIELEGVVLAVAIVLDTFILSLFWLALSPLHASFLTCPSWCFVSKHYLSEVESFVIILLVFIRVVLQCLFVPLLLLLMR